MIVKQIVKTSDWPYYLYERTSNTSRRIKRLVVSATNINTGRSLLRWLEIKFLIFFKIYWDLITKEAVYPSLLSASQLSASHLYTRRLRRLRRLRRHLDTLNLRRLAFNASKSSKARFRRRSTHVPNLIDELSPAKERRLNQFGTAVLILCGNVVKFEKVCRIIRHWSGN